MKAIIVCVIAVVLVTSCKKDYTCNCRDASGNITEVTVIHNTKSSASKTCQARKNPPESCSIQ